MNSLLEPIDIYCERLSGALLAEPVNFVTNLSFIIAAAWLYRSYRQANKRDGFLLVLIGMVGVIGIGSGIFHSVATRGAMLLDVIPITLFLISYIAYFSRRICHFHWGMCAVSIVLFLLLGYLSGFVPEAYRMNGTISYAPALIFLCAMAFHTQRTKRFAEATLLYIAASIFVVSMGFRSLDQLICPALPLGTHFLWHLLNGLVLYLVVKAMIYAKPGYTR